MKEDEEVAYTGAYIGGRPRIVAQAAPKGHPATDQGTHRWVY